MNGRALGPAGESAGEQESERYLDIPHTEKLGNNGGGCTSFHNAQMLTLFCSGNKAGRASPSSVSVPKVPKSSCDSDGMDLSFHQKRFIWENGSHSSTSSHGEPHAQRVCKNSMEFLKSRSSHTVWLMPACSPLVPSLRPASGPGVLPTQKPQLVPLLWAGQLPESKKE